MIISIIMLLILIVSYISETFISKERFYLATIIIAMVIIGILSPHIYLLKHYLKNSKDKSFKTEFDEIHLREKDVYLQYKIEEIVLIEYVEFWNYNYLSLEKFNYLRYHFYDGYKFVITSLMHDDELFDTLYKYNCPIKCINKWICLVDEKSDKFAKNNESRSLLLSKVK